MIDQSYMNDIYQSYMNVSLSIRLLLQLEHLMEQCSLEIRGEVQQIFKVLSKQEHDKMPFQGIEIAKTLTRLPFFRRYFDTNSEQFINLCISQDAISVTDQHQPYEHQKIEGRERYIYVILEGTVMLQSKECGTRMLGVLMIFGQTEIMYGLDSRREKATIVGSCKIMRIRQTSIAKIFERKDDLLKKLHFLNVNSYFQQLSELQKMQLGLCLNKLSFQKGEILKTEGDGLQNIYFFIYGKVEVITHLTLKEKDRQYVIDSLQQMSAFGQYECFTGVQTPQKLKAKTSGSYYLLNYPEITKQQHRMKQILSSKAIAYPSNQQLIFLQNVKSTLKKQEKRVMKDLKYIYC